VWRLDREGRGWCKLLGPSRGHQRDTTTIFSERELIKDISVNKAELIDVIADKADISKASAARALDAALEGIVSALRGGDQVALVGFGTFSVKERAERQGRNPQTGATMLISASRNATFKPGKALKDAVS
jgi:DNA-binding protein HU-beta